MKNSPKYRRLLFLLKPTMLKNGRNIEKKMVKIEEGTTGFTEIAIPSAGESSYRKEYNQDCN